MSPQRVENISPEILRKCREQTGLTLHDVGKKIPKIADMEKGEWKPTFGQLTKLAGLYSLPRWVLACGSLPEQYQFDQDTSFRKFSSDREKTFSHPKIRRMTVEVERLRNLVLDLREDMDDPVEPFKPPELEPDASVSRFAGQVRCWLECGKRSLDFGQWREKLEERNIFVFTTSKYLGWSFVEQKQFRGLAIYHSTLPVIVINSSDYRKALTFSLFHELGHLLKKQSGIDEWEDDEQWCDEFAACVLMPDKEFLDVVRRHDAEDLENVRKTAAEFKVSEYACLVRMKQLRIINFKTYKHLEARLKYSYEQYAAEFKKKNTRIKRVRSKEVLDQYGHIYSRAVIQAYRNQEIGLNGLCMMFSLKKVSDAFELEQRIG